MPTTPYPLFHSPIPLKFPPPASIKIHRLIKSTSIPSSFMTHRFPPHRLSPSNHPRSSFPPPPISRSNHSQVCVRRASHRASSHFIHSALVSHLSLFMSLPLSGYTIFVRKTISVQ
uniref:Uncharacterized protein n=1 Tax=Kalanchoe fedtschenkoi TaxID=63787 RepID=A0A7N0ZYI4_KALFE